MTRSERRRIGEILRAARKEANLSQLDLARKLKTTDKYISAVERGIVGISVTRLTAFGHAFGQHLVIGFSPVRSEVTFEQSIL